jgi:hypothetical protein
MSHLLRITARTFIISLLLCTVCKAQIGYGVDANGNLFSFTIAPAGPFPVTSIGNLGFTPEGIDFKPGTNTLYAIDVGPVKTQLYTVDINTAAATVTSSNFPTVGGSYNLGDGPRFGFDFIPNTLTPAGNMLIRLITTRGDNLRINSNDGSLASEDTDLLIQPGSNAPFTDALAYINNIPTQGTFATEAYDMDTRNNSLFTQNPANGGQLNLVGAFGVTIVANSGIGFDIYTTPGDADPGIGGDSAYAVFTRNATQGGAYLLYDVNLATGATTNGRLIGVGSNADFTGGFAIAPVAIPEPASTAILAFAVAACGTLRARYRVKLW